MAEFHTAASVSRVLILCMMTHWCSLLGRFELNRDVIVNAVSNTWDFITKTSQNAFISEISI